MSARSLRILVAFAFVFTLFIYIASTQVNNMVPVKSSEEGLLGGPISGLSRWQLSKFEEGRELFRKEFQVKDGLGPLFNAKSCVSCHGGAGTAGGAGTEPGYGSYSLFAKRIPSGRFAAEAASLAASKLEWQDMDFLPDQGGPFLVEKSISKVQAAGLPDGCRIDANLNPPQDAEYTGKYYAPPLFGLGLVNCLSDIYLNGLLAKDLSGPKPLGARRALVPGHFQGIGRFGYKGSYSSLHECTADELAHQIGISNPLHRHSFSAKGIDKFPDCAKGVCPADPNDDGKVLAKIDFYLSLLAPPPRANSSPEVYQGELVFQKTGCAACHVKTLRTPERVFLLNPDGPYPLTVDGAQRQNGEPIARLMEEPKFVEVRALEKKDFSPYSDFLLHDMGPALADGIPGPGAKGGEWRSTPLWGLRHKKWYLHDGRAKTLTEAIKKHAGQAANSAKAFNGLSDPEKANLLKFLMSL